MPITPLPTLDRTSATFRTDVDTFFGSQLPAFATEANALQTDVNAKQVTATTQAGIATTKAGEALTSANNAATSKTNADNARDAALAAQAAAELALDSFDDRYLGAKAVAPALDNDGNTLLTGALYWDTVLPGMRAWTGAAWSTLPAATAAATANTPAGNIAATNVQAALNELDTEKQALTSKDASGGYAGLTLFKLNLRNAANTITSWLTTAATVARTWTFPDKDGTVAMTSDITGRNKIINGALDIWQRGVSFSNAAGVASYAADRWYCGSSGATLTITRDTDVPGGLYGYSLKLVDAGDSFTYALQRIEAANAKMVAGTTMTLSFWIKAASYAKAQIVFEYASTADNFSAVTNISSTDVSSQITLNTWSYVTTQVTLPAQAANGISISMFTNYAYGGASTAYLTRMQFEPGSVATPFESRPYGMELALCQRYYYKSFPGAISKPLDAYGANNSTTFARCVTKFPVTMRIAPVAIEQSGVANQYAVSQAGIGFNVCSSVPVFSTSTADMTTTAFTVASGLTQFNPSGAYTDATNGAGAYLAWSAEL